jgi:hypothetical protein
MIEFEHAAWLWGLLALAFPVLLHLLGRRAVPPKDFPPAVLLEKAGARRITSRRIKEIVLLALRMLLLAAVVLAFARPRVPEKSAAVEGKTAPTALVLVIDDSLSMTRPADPARPRGPSRFARALEAAGDALGRLGPGSEAAVVFASGRSAGPALPSELAAELSGRGGSRRADLGRALEAAPQFLEAMAPLDPAVLVVSDCEVGALSEDVLSALRKVARVSVLDVGASGAGDDWALVGARLDRRRLVAGEDVEVLVGLARSPGEGAVAVRQLQLVLGGQAVAWRAVSLAAGAEVEVPLGFSVGGGTHLGELRLVGADSWVHNDHLPVALSARRPARVAVICAQRDIDGAGRAVRLALSAGPGEERKAFLAETLAARAAALSADSGYRAFVLIGPPRMAEASRARLARAVAGGAGAVLLCEDPAALGELAVALGLPVPPCAEKLVRVESNARLVPERAGEDLFATFRPAAAADVFRRTLELKPGGGTVLARMRAPGLDLPGLVEHDLGRGPVITLSSSPAGRYSRLAGREHANLFVPLMHELTGRAAGLTPAETAASPGSAVRIAALPQERAARFWLYGASGLRSPLGSPDEKLRLHLTAPERPGAYRLLSESDARPLAERALAVRDDPAELSGRRPAAAADAGRSLEVRAALGAVTRGAGRGRELASTLAALGLLLLLVEALAGFVAAGRPARRDEDLPARKKRGRAPA